MKNTLLSIYWVFVLLLVWAWAIIPLFVIQMLCVLLCKIIAPIDVESCQEWEKKAIVLTIDFYNKSTSYFISNHNS